MISWIDFRDFYEINSGLYGNSQAPLPPAEMMVALLTIARASRELADEAATGPDSDRRKVA
jgi:hypothetical protein